MWTYLYIIMYRIQEFMCVDVYDICTTDNICPYRYMLNIHVYNSHIDICRVYMCTLLDDYVFYQNSIVLNYSQYKYVFIICMRMHPHMILHRHTWVCIPTCMAMYVYIHRCTWVCISMHAHKCTLVQTYICMFTIGVYTYL